MGDGKASLLMDPCSDLSSFFFFALLISCDWSELVLFLHLPGKWVFERKG